MTRVSFLIPTSCLLFTACTTMDDPADDAIDDPAAGGAGEVVQEASVGSPSIVRGGSSTAHVIDSLSGSYSGLEIDGGSELGAFLVATYYPSSTYGNVTGQFTVTAAPGAAFVYSLKGTGSGYSRTHLRLERLPGSTDLRAATATSIVTCGGVPSGTPTVVAVSLATSASRFSVSINGAPTACTNLSTRIAPPITGFEMMDASNQGYGGVVRFEGLAYP